MPVSAVHTWYWELSWVLLTLTSRFLVGHCWTADGSTIWGNAPTVPSVAVALHLKSIEHVNIVLLKLNTSMTHYCVVVFFFATSLYVPSGLHTGTKTCGKSFLACCSVYFFSATHLDVSAEPPQITGISPHHHKSPPFNPQLKYFLTQLTPA